MDRAEKVLPVDDYTLLAISGSFARAGGDPAVFIAPHALEETADRWLLDRGSTQIDPEIPKVRIDREAIARALVNLVNNALKYSDNEKFLGVRLYRDKAVLKLEVSDRGIGIAPAEQDKIFEKFYRCGDPLVHNTKGSGLGLSLVRHIAQAHGGNVSVESAPQKGSKFTIALPINPIAANGQAQASPA